MHPQSTNSNGTNGPNLGKEILFDTNNWNTVRQPDAPHNDDTKRMKRDDTGEPDNDTRADPASAPQESAADTPSDKRRKVTFTPAATAASRSSEIGTGDAEADRERRRRREAVAEIIQQVANKALFKAVHYVPEKPTFPWNYNELPDPIRCDAVARCSHRFQVGCSADLDEHRLSDLRTCLYMAIVDQLTEVDRSDFAIRHPFNRGNKIYIDVNVINKKVYGEFKKLQAKWGRLDITLASSAAPLDEMQQVFRMGTTGNGTLDVRVKVEDVVCRILKQLAGHVKVSDAWGMYSKQIKRDGTKYLQFEGIIYLLGTVSRPSAIQSVPAFVDLSGIPYAGGELPLWFTDRPIFCTACRPIPGRHHLATECPQKRCKHRGPIDGCERPCDTISSTQGRSRYSQPLSHPFCFEFSFLNCSADVGRAGRCYA